MSKWSRFKFDIILNADLIRVDQFTPLQKTVRILLRRQEIWVRD